MIRLLFIIGIGGFLGTISRFLANRWFVFHFPSAFPYGTFFVNLAGCFLIGLFYGIFNKLNFVSSEWRLFLTVGFCGGFTTFSAFAAENLAMLRENEFFNLFFYSGSSFILGLAAVFCGIMLVKLI